jgi:3-hydroxyacyl-[acyl-carrier-protein] dehydratase
MFRNSLYRAIATHQDSAVSADIVFNPDHDIFVGHFPGNPVVPGVCMIQIVRELLEDALKMKFQIRSGDNVKFLSVINPVQTPEVQVSIQFVQQGDELNVQASFAKGDITYFKFKGTFGKVSYEL